MTINEILYLYDQQMRISPPTFKADCRYFPGMTVCIVDPPAPHGGWVMFTRLEEDTIDAAIQQNLALFSERGHSFEWKTYDHDTPGDLRQRLLIYGFVAEDEEALLALDLTQAPQGLFKPVKADVRRVTGPEGIDDIHQIEQSVWGHDFDNLRRVLNEELAENPAGISLYVAYVGGEPAACAWIRFYEGKDFADLWGGSTIEKFRRKGLYTALVAVRAQEARQRGARFLTIDASPMSRPICEKIGFKFLTNTQPFVWKA